MKNEQIPKLTLPVTKEPILGYWAMRAGKNGRGYLSQTVGLALEHYILNQSFITIARLHEEEESEEFPATIVFMYSMSPIIRSWIAELKKSGISLVEAVRFVLLNSIKTIPAKEAEFMINRGTVNAVATPADNFEQLLFSATAKISKQIKTEDTNSPDNIQTEEYFISPGIYPGKKQSEGKKPKEGK